MYIDLHSHSTRSDGALSPTQLVESARDAGISILAISDHNYTESLDTLRLAYPDMTLIQAAEMSCSYTDLKGIEHEIHIVALGLDPEYEPLRTIMDNARPDRRDYIEKILSRLRDNRIDLGSYEDLRQRFPDTMHLGRMAIAVRLVEEGHTNSIDESFDVYLGTRGEQRAYVKSDVRFVPLETMVEEIVRSGAIPVLAHLLHYEMDEEDRRCLVRRFKDCAGDRGAMEVYYRHYDETERAYLMELCQEHRLWPSAASDQHGAYHEGDGSLATLCPQILTYLKCPLVDALI